MQLFLKDCITCFLNFICVTAAGWRASNTQFTFVPARVGSGRCTHWVITATRSSIMVMNTISTLMGRHALASPKGGGPCSLGTFNYGVASHLAFQFNLNALTRPGKQCWGTQVWYTTIPEGYGATEKQQSNSLQWWIQDFPNGGALFCHKWGGAHPVFR